MPIAIAYTTDDERHFDSDATTVTINYKILPNNNPEHPNGFAPLIYSDHRRKCIKHAWHSSHLTKDEAAKYALDEIADECSHYIGDWNIRVRRAEDSHDTHS